MTTGGLHLAGVIPLNGEDSPRAIDAHLTLAAALESGFAHPIARALAAAAPAPVERRYEECKSVAGAGVEASRDGVRVRLGSPQFVAGLGIGAPPARLATVADDLIVVALGDERGWTALFTFSDPLRAHARAVVQELIGMGRRVHLVSGDRPEIVDRIAKELGIIDFCGGVSPSEKLAYVQRLQQEGAVVAMVGDGVNDAAAMAAAQVSLAMGGGADITCGNSDVVVLSDRLDALLALVRTSRATLRVIRQNLAWAFAYNGVAIPLAACGYVSPLLAGAGMAASSLLVVANALRLLRHAPPTALGRAAQPAYA